MMVFLHFHHYMEIRKNANGFTISFPGKLDIVFYRLSLPHQGLLFPSPKGEKFPLAGKKGSPRSLVMGILLGSPRG